jgi:hypothetical protein
MHYDHESNILSWEIGSGKIDHVREIGNFLIHVTKKEKPVLVEILDASNLIGQLDKFKAEEVTKMMPVNYT